MGVAEVPNMECLGSLGIGLRATAGPFANVETRPWMTELRALIRWHISSMFGDKGVTESMGGHIGARKFLPL